MTPIVVSQDRLEELAFENPGSSIEIHTHTSSLRVGDVLYIASLPEPEPARPDIPTGTEYDLYADKDRGTALAAQHIAEMKAAAFGGGER